jgi:hypothetical protein
MSNYGKVKSFRLDKEDEKLLNECFDILNVSGSSFNRKMVTFIMATHARLKEIKGLQEKVDTQKQKIKEQDKEIMLLQTQIPPPVTPTIMEKPSEVEPVTPTQTTQKVEVSKEEPKPIREAVKFSSDGMSVQCKGIYYNNWVGKEICAVCQDKECEIKKGTVTFPKQKPRTQYPLKRW